MDDNSQQPIQSPQTPIPPPTGNPSPGIITPDVTPKSNKNKSLSFLVFSGVCILLTILSLGLAILINLNGGDNGFILFLVFILLCLVSAVSVFITVLTIVINKIKGKNGKQVSGSSSVVAINWRPPIILICLYLLASGPIIFFTISNNLQGASMSNLSKSQIAARLNKLYTLDPPVDHIGDMSSLAVHKDCSELFYIPCNQNTVIAYQYSGDLYLKGANFTTPFRLKIYVDKTQLDEVSSSFLLASPHKKSDFIKLYNGLGEKTIGQISGLSFGWTGDYDPVASSTVIAGYKFGDLFITCRQSVDCNESNSTVPKTQTTKQGTYIFYFNENSQSWSLLTDDGRYLVDWVSYQASKGIPATQIDWSKSPIKPYSP